MTSLIAALLLSTQGPPVYTATGTTPFDGGACDSTRVQINATTGDQFCCVGSVWVRCGPYSSAKPLLAMPDNAFPGAYALSDFPYSGLVVANVNGGVPSPYTGSICTLPQVVTGLGSTGVATCSQPTNITGTATALSTSDVSTKFWAGDNTWRTPAGGGGGSSVYVDAEIPSGAINGSNVTYTLASTPSPASSLHLYANGVRLRPTTDYSLSTATITMVAALQTGDWFYADYRTTTTGSYADAEIPTGTVNGSNTAFTLANAPAPGTSLHLYINGVRMRPTTDYSISGTSLTMVWVPQTGDWLYADYRY